MTVNDEVAFLKGCSVREIASQCFMLHLFYAATTKFYKGI